jgi:hypothetical protein
MSIFPEEVDVDMTMMTKVFGDDVRKHWNLLHGCFEVARDTCTLSKVFPQYGHDFVFLFFDLFV